MITNILDPEITLEAVSDLFSTVSKPARMQIIIVLGESEACVCHLEAALGMRQASISQHLMVLRKAGIVSANRDGRNIFYKLEKPVFTQLINQICVLSGFDVDRLLALAKRPVPGCCCPQCNPEGDPNLACKPKSKY